MEKEVNGLKNQKSNTQTKLKCVLGFSDEETLKLDFDNVSFRTAKYWCQRACRQFHLEGFIILKSSPNHYHAVFNKPMLSWDDNMKYVAWICLWTKYRRLTEWLIMQLIKKCSTLRISPKGNKPMPRVVYKYGRQDKKIKEFLDFRNKIKRIYRNLLKLQSNTTKDMFVETIKNHECYVQT